MSHTRNVDSKLQRSETIKMIKQLLAAAEAGELISLVAVSTNREGFVTGHVSYLMEDTHLIIGGYEGLKVQMFLALSKGEDFCASDDNARAH